MLTDTESKLARNLADRVVLGLVGMAPEQRLHFFTEVMRAYCATCGRGINACKCFEDTVF